MMAIDPIGPGESRYGPSNRTLLAASCYAVAASVVLLLVPDLPTAVRLPLALPLLLFVPGYAVVTAAIPAGRPPTTGAPADGPVDPDQGQPRLSRLERGILAIVVNLAIVPSVALAAEPLVGVHAGAVLVGLTALTVLASTVAVRRGSGRRGTRNRSQRSDPFATVSTLGSAVTQGARPVAIALVAVLLLASAAVTVAGNDPGPGTEFYLANDAGSDRVDDGNRTFDLRIEHHGEHSERYMVVVLANQTVERDGDAGARTVGRFSTVVAPDETAVETVTADDTAAPPNTTYWFLLYRDDAPADPNVGSAHRALKVSGRV